MVGISLATMMQGDKNFCEESCIVQKKPKGGPFGLSSTFATHVMLLLGPQKIRVNLYAKWKLDDTSYYEFIGNFCQFVGLENCHYCKKTF